MRNPNGYGGVTKLPGNRRRPYRARITSGWEERPEGGKKQLFTTLGCYATQEEALAALAEYHTLPTDLSQRQITFREVYDRWSALHYRKYPSVRRINESAMNYCRPLWDIPMRDIRTSDLQRIILSMDGLSAAYQTKVKSMIHMMYSWCIRNDILHKDYSVFIETCGGEAETKRRIFSHEEICALWSVYRSDVSPAGEPLMYRGTGLIATVLFLLYTGMRVGEMLSLRTEDVHLGERYIDLHGTKTKAARRIVPIHRDIVDLTAAQLTRGGDTFLYLPEIEGLTYSKYKYSWFDKVMAGLGMRHTPHDARHTFISGLDSAGVPRSTQKFIVGHSLTSDVTDRYTHKSIAELTEAVDSLQY